MKTRILALALSAALLPFAATAQQYYNDYEWDDYAYDDYYAPSTGDAGLDTLLQAINALFNDQPDYYAERLVYETRVEPVIVREYLVERQYAPADVYMMGTLAQLSGKSFADVARTYEANRGQGWGNVARQLGIKPGSAQFHQLKNGGNVFVQQGKARGKGRGDAARPVRTSQTVDAPVVQRGPAHGKPAGHPGKGHGKGKGNNGKGKGNGKDK